jgi:hypothetical protein
MLKCIFINWVLKWLDSFDCINFLIQKNYLREEDTKCCFIMLRHQGTSIIDNLTISTPNFDLTYYKVFLPPLSLILIIGNCTGFLVLLGAAKIQVGLQYKNNDKKEAKFIFFATFIIHTYQYVPNVAKSMRFNIYI